MLKTTLFSLTTFTLAATLLVPSPAAAQSSSANPSASPAPRQPVPSASSTTPSRSAGKTSSSLWTDADYKLGAGDKLRVDVYRNEQLSQSVQIRPDGKITLPLINDVPAAGKTPSELKDALTTQFKEYVNNPVVTVIVQDAVSAQISIIGEVRSPGPQVMNGSLTVLQALAKAGGLGEFANKSKIHILRHNGSRTESVDYDYKRTLNGEAEDVYLQPGDTIVVP
jgi:polysaccharide export outer membrane protein